MTDLYEQKYRAAYIKYLYYKRKNRIWKKLGYKCQICGNSDADALELHHKDNKTWTHVGGRDRIDNAIQLLDNNELNNKVELLCSKCHDLRDMGRSKKEIKKALDSPQYEKVRENWEEIK